MKKLFYIIFTVYLTNIYGQRQVSLLADWSINKNKLTSYSQSSFGIFYRTKQNSFGTSINSINGLKRTGFYHIIGGTALLFRHLNKKTLSGIYIGTYFSYMQYSEIYRRKMKYNETPPFVIIEFPIYGPDSELHQFRQIKVVPTFGYEYYPLTWLSIFAELGCGILFVNNFKTEWQKADKPTNNSYDIYGNLNLKFGLKTVIWHKDKNSSN